MIPPIPVRPAGMSAIQEWQILVQQIKEQAQLLVDSVEGRATRVYTANGLESLIEQTEGGKPVGDSGLTKEQAQQLQVLVGSFRAFINNPIEEAGGRTPAELLSLR